MGSFRNVLHREQDPTCFDTKEGLNARRVFVEMVEEDGSQRGWAKRIEGVVEAIVSFRMERDLGRGAQKDELVYYEELVSQAQGSERVGSRHLTLSSADFLMWWEQEKNTIIAQRRV